MGLARRGPPSSSRENARGFGRFRCAAGLGTILRPCPDRPDTPSAAAIPGSRRPSRTRRGREGRTVRPRGPVASPARISVRRTLEPMTWSQVRMILPAKWVGEGPRLRAQDHAGIVVWSHKEAAAAPVRHRGLLRRSSTTASATSSGRSSPRMPDDRTWPREASDAAPRSGPASPADLPPPALRPPDRRRRRRRGRARAGREGLALLPRLQRGAHRRRDVARAERVRGAGRDGRPRLQGPEQREPLRGRHPRGRRLRRAVAPCSPTWSTRGPTCRDATSSRRPSCAGTRRSGRTPRWCAARRSPRGRSSPPGAVVTKDVRPTPS